mmetsp:Transcript_21286/g.61953  ORF Transcript_21286/g.61953 Transcript_21286/m.61953 type:complete len:405 (-) Transcript_21286:849-2063(-)
MLPMTSLVISNSCVAFSSSIEYERTMPTPGSIRPAPVSRWIPSVPTAAPTSTSSSSSDEDCRLISSSTSSAVTPPLEPPATLGLTDDDEVDGGRAGFSLPLRARLRRSALMSGKKRDRLDDEESTNDRIPARRKSSSSALSVSFAISPPLPSPPVAGGADDAKLDLANARDHTGSNAEAKPGSLLAADCCPYPYCSLVGWEKALNAPPSPLPNRLPALDAAAAARNGDGVETERLMPSEECRLVAPTLSSSSSLSNRAAVRARGELRACENSRGRSISLSSSSSSSSIPPPRQPSKATLSLDAYGGSSVDGRICTRGRGCSVADDRSPAAPSPTPAGADEMVASHPSTSRSKEECRTSALALPSPLLSSTSASALSLRDMCAGDSAAAAGFRPSSESSPDFSPA